MSVKLVQAFTLSLGVIMPYVNCKPLALSTENLMTASLRTQPLATKYINLLGPVYLFIML